MASQFISWGRSRWPPGFCSASPVSEELNDKGTRERNVAIGTVARRMQLLCEWNSCYMNGTDARRKEQLLGKCDSRCNGGQQVRVCKGRATS